ncbi:glycoside hydrolase superfamily [Calycina marina]|uniref:chitinase n=1 Tax=Calycina marina TaxID=1763456 RepID=A0A9P7Z458_9HELO|nr:glycoside hydrolase superfamily [Calycina marina]
MLVPVPNSQYTGMVLLQILVAMVMAQLCESRYVMYLTGQHNIIPEPRLAANITHVALAFMPSSRLNEPITPLEWPLFTTVEAVRNQFAKGTSVMVAIGGWGDTQGFSTAAATDETRRLFANNVKAVVDITGADGVDVDWEYPGGNGEDYGRISNSEKAWEIEAYPKLLAAIRAALGPDKIMSAAVPGLPRDMLAITKNTIPKISKSLDFYNIMTYDLMNRRDSVTKHHTGIQLSLESIDAYLAAGVPVEKMNLGFAFYVKWFRTDPGADCATHPIGCKTLLLEDPVTGDDLGRAGAFSWHDEVPPDLRKSFSKALNEARYDDVGGGTYYSDSEENIWWSWDSEADIKRKISTIVEKKRLGGVFAWGLGEDAPEFSHLKALNSYFETKGGGIFKDEL